MQTLYIDRKDTRIELDRERILVHTSSLPRPLSIALSYLESIVISAKTALTSSVLLACAKRGIAVIMLDPKNYECHAQYIPANSGIVNRKIKQYEILRQDKICLTYAKQLIAAQQRQKLKLLFTWQKQYQRTDQAFLSLFTQLKTVQTKVTKAKNLSQLLGFEAMGAKIIFQAIEKIAPAWCAFDGRNRRPPKDPINAVLSLSYTLCYADSSKALQGCALDSMLGFYHQPVHGRFSLACDLNELLRSDTERWVMSLFTQKTLLAKHFITAADEACTLSKEGRSVFYPLWQQQAKIWRRYLRKQAQDWAKQVDLA